jgi:mono/diheme cytochrome c family protein
VTGIAAIAVLWAGACLIYKWSSGCAVQTSESLAAVADDSYEKRLLPFLGQYCADCHGDGAHEGDFTYDRCDDLDALKRDRHVWTRVLKKLKTEAMPPADADQPSAEERARAVAWLDHQLFYVDCGRPQDPGRVTVRRLNKNEYNNTVRDLLGVDFQPANDFPADDTGHGFDTIGDVLTVPPLLLEKYLTAAEEIADRAIGRDRPGGWVREWPRADLTPAAAARANFKAFLPRAFRRDVPAEECERYVGLAQRALDRGDSFEQAMNLTLQAVLVSPHFLFRVEGGRRQEAGVEMLDDFALASRLSYFLWSSMPDDELFEQARQNRLHDPEVLKQQTLRLLNDPRSDAFVSNFAGQWLGLRRLTTKDVRPDAAQFPGFDDQMRLDLWKETELFVGSIVRSNASIYDLLTGRYSFLNERLARHYGIAGVSGPEFRRVDFQDERRSGVLTQGSFLTLTSHPARTSPVKRGEWVLTNLLGDAPPEPPPSVPTLEKTQAAHPTLTLRQQMERHRADPACATCHRAMDAIGFGLENFDPVGRWRERDGTQPIDAKGALPTGEEFDGPMELIAILNQRRADFGRCLTEKLLTYALGRGVEWYDKCAVDEILARLRTDDRFATLILAIVESAPFQMRRAQEPPPESREPPS